MEQPFKNKTYFDGVGERQGDSERQSFRHCDDEDSDANDDELDVVTEVVRLPVMALLLSLLLKLCSLSTECAK